MKHLFTLFALLIVMLRGHAQVVQTVINPTKNSWGGTSQALLYKPDDYSSTTTKYPLLVFLHGAGQAYGGLSSIYNSSAAGGPAYFIEHAGWPASFTNPKDGQTYKFIVLSPQAAATQPGSGWSSSAQELDYMIRYMVTNYRVDTNRIYITGISAGGDGICDYATHAVYSGSRYVPRYKAAAMVPMSQAGGNYPQADCNIIVADSTRAWGFGDADNDVHGGFTKTLIDKMNIAKAGFGRFTNFVGPDGNHCCWGTYYNPTYRETIGGVSMNIYEWMLTHTQVPVTAPTANAGSNQTITLPVSSVTLNGSGTAGAGYTITSYGWTQLSGPGTATIATPALASTNVSGLIQGTYVFRLTVTNSNGATATSNVSVTVNPVPPPVAKAGPDQTITLPVSSVTLNGSSSTGTITAYAWTMISGPNTPVITTPAAVSTTVTGLVQGTYVFQLSVNSGASTDQVSVTVSPAGVTRYIKVRLYGGSNPYTTGGWNNWNIASNLGSGALKYATGENSAVTITTNYTTMVADNSTSYVVTMCPQEVARYASYASQLDATFTITGLDNSKTYNIETYNTRDKIGPYVTEVSIGSVMRAIVTDTNRATPAVFTGLTPTNGTIVINLHRPSNSTYHYINGLQITELGSSGGLMLAKAAPQTEEDEASWQTFPIPFYDYVVLKKKFEKAQQKLTVTITDMAGRVLYNKPFGDVPQGVWNQRLDFSGKLMPPGIYLLQVTGPDLAKPVTMKLVKGQ